MHQHEPTGNTGVVRNYRKLDRGEAQRREVEAAERLPDDREEERISE